MIITLAEKEEKSAREMMAASPEFDFEAIREIALHNQEYSLSEVQ